MPDPTTTAARCSVCGDEIHEDRQVVTRSFEDGQFVGIRHDRCKHAPAVPPPAAMFEQLRDAAVAELPKVCDHHRPCACRRRWIERFIYVGTALAGQGWTVAP